MKIRLKFLLITLFFSYTSYSLDSSEYLVDNQDFSVTHNKQICSN